MILKTHKTLAVFIPRLAPILIFFLILSFVFIFLLQLFFFFAFLFILLRDRRKIQVIWEVVVATKKGNREDRKENAIGFFFYLGGQGARARVILLIHECI